MNQYTLTFEHFLIPLKTAEDKEKAAKQLAAELDYEDIEGLESLRKQIYEYRHKMYQREPESVDHDLLNALSIIDEIVLHDLNTTTNSQRLARIQKRIRAELFNR